MRLVNKTRFAVCIAAVLIIIAGVLNINKIIVTKEKENSKTSITENATIQEIKNLITLSKTITFEEPKTYYEIPLSKELQDHIRDMCIKYNVDMENIISIIHTESEFNHNNKTPNESETGCSIGLLQLNNNYIDWYKELTHNDEFDIYNDRDNVEGGIAVFRFYKSYWQSKGYTGNDLFIRSCNSYNMGISKYRKYIRNTGEISRSYDRKVIRYKEKLTKK